MNSSRSSLAAKKTFRRDWQETFSLLARIFRVSIIETRRRSETVRSEGLRLAKRRRSAEFQSFGRIPVDQRGRVMRGPDLPPSFSEAKSG
jgi:hypothetical protein